LIRLQLPFPVPLSACFKDVVVKSKTTGQTFRTRAPTGRYKDWQKSAHRMIEQQVTRDGEAVVMPGQVQVFVRLKAPDKRERDAGNTDKAICDILVKARIITNDSNRYVKRLTFAWVDDGVPCEVFIKPMELAA
jgi:crossover junction endodeoxyribonuclease RusA